MSPEPNRVRVAAHGAPVQAQFAADLGEVHAAGQGGVDLGVPGAGPGTHFPLPCRGHRRGGGVLGLDRLLAQAGPVAGDSPLHGAGEVVQQVPPVGHLRCEGGAAGGAVGIASGPVPADHLRPWMGIQPGAEGVR